MSRLVLRSGIKPAADAMTEAMDTYGRYSGVIAQIPLIGKTEYPAGWIGPLIKHYGLVPVEEFLPFYNDPAYAFKEAMAWQRIRGTAKAYRQSASWIGVGVEIEKGNKGKVPDHVQEHLGKLVHGEELDRLLKLGRLSKSDTSVYFRLIHGLDFRPLRGAFSKNAHAIYGRSSGVRRKDGEPLLSFKVASSIVVRRPLSISIHAADSAVDGSHVDIHRPIVLARDKFGSRLEFAPPSDVRLTDVDKVAFGAKVCVEKVRSRPEAGVIGAHSRLAHLQSVYVAFRLIRGGHFRLAAAVQISAPPKKVRVNRVEEATKIGLVVGTTSNAIAAETRSIGISVQNAPSIKAEEGIGEFAGAALKRSAGWSGLPWLEDRSWDPEHPIAVLTDRINSEN